MNSYLGGSIGYAKAGARVPKTSHVEAGKWPQDKGRNDHIRIPQKDDSTDRERKMNTNNQSNTVELLTQQEASAVLHKTPRVLRFWRTAGIGPAYVKLGKTVLYDRNDLIAYVRSNTVQPSVRAAIEEENCVAL